MEKVSVGQTKICVDTSSLDPKRSKVYTYSAPPGMKKDLPTPSETSLGTYVAIPAKYADPATTDVLLDVKSGNQTFDIKLQ